MLTTTTSTPIKTKKITAATFKSFVKKNYEKVYIKVKSDFNGMTDSVEQINDEFTLGTTRKCDDVEYSLGFAGIYLVGRSRDYFYAYEDEKYVGYKVSNSCGSFIVAIQK